MTLRLDFTTLRIFLAVAGTGSIARASEREHIASSAISKRLSDLEEMLGTRLFYRMPRGVELTPAGEALRHHAQNILNSADRLAADLGDYAVGFKGHVRMMANPSALSQFLPEDLAAFCSRFPEINIDLQEEYSWVIVKAVADGRCDIGIFADDAASHEGLKVFDYRTDRMVVLVPKSHPLAERSSVQFADVLDQNLIGLETMTAWDALLSRGAREAGREIKYRFRLRDIHSLCGMVAAGLGVTLMSEGIVSVFDPGLGLVAVELKEAWARRSLRIAIRGLSDLPQPARLMVSHLRGVPAEIKTSPPAD